MSIATSLSRSQKLFWGQCDSLYEAATLQKRPGLVTQLNLGEYEGVITVLFEEPSQLESLSTITKGVRVWLAPSFFKGLSTTEIDRLCKEVLQYFAEIHYIHINSLTTVRVPRLLQLPNLNWASFIDGLGWSLSSGEFHDLITHTSPDRWEEVLKKTSLYSLLLETIEYMLPRVSSPYIKGHLLSFHSVSESLQLEEIGRFSEDEDYFVHSIKGIARTTQYPKVIEALAELDSVQINDTLASRSDSLPESLQWQLATADATSTRIRVAANAGCNRDMLIWFLSDKYDEVRRVAANNIIMVNDMPFIQMLASLPDFVVVGAVAKSHALFKKEEHGAREIQQTLVSNWEYVSVSSKEYLVQSSSSFMIPSLMSKLAEEDSYWIAQRLLAHRRISGKILVQLWNKWAKKSKDQGYLLVLGSIARNYKCPSSLRRAIFLTIKKDPVYYNGVAKGLSSNAKCGEEELYWIYNNCSYCAPSIAQNKGAPMPLRRRCGYVGV